jgi:CBS domain containing-hemolysin-like protein
MDGPGQSNSLAALAIVRAASDFQVPSFDGTAWLQLFIMIVALILCAVASASETAFTSISRIKLKNMVEEGDQRAIKIDQLVSKPNTFLTTILVVNNVAVIVASTMATVLALRFSQSYGELIATIFSSIVVLIFCEITPKTAAVQNPMRFARAMVNPVRGAAWVLHPVVVSLSAITNFLVRILGGQVVHRGPFVTEEELRLLVTVGEEEGVLEEEETEMIHSIFEFADTSVREVMIPRIDMVTLESDASVDEAVDLALQGGFSRIPVFEETIDNVIGILYIKDMVRQLREGHNQLAIRELVRPAYFVPETKKLDDLLREIRQRRTHIAIVIDEYGSVSGLVTIEDLVEEIVGDIRDEYDIEENVYEQVSKDEYIVDAKMSIGEFDDLLETNLENENYDTLGGFLYAQLDKIPVAGDTITYNDLTFTILTTRGRRITKVRVVRARKQDQQQSQPLHLVPNPSSGAEGDNRQRDPGDEHSRIESRGA